MHLSRSVLFVALLGLFTSKTFAQELSTETFPSEDEIIEALQLGEITVSQFNRLQEIAALGVDSRSMFLLDEIPNLTFFSRDSLSNFPPLQRDQLSGFIKQPDKKQALRGVLSWQFYQRLEEKGNGDESRYRFGADIHLSPMWRTDFRIHREYNGEERFVRRTITYHNRNKTLRRVRIGNYSERLGLGTIIGYRGKLIDFSS